MFLAASTGTPAFGLERFGAGEPKGKFVYFTEEDSERVVAQRLRWLLAGRTLSHPPENLYLKGRAGLNFLNPKDQKGILEALGRAGAVGAAFDPARAYMPGIDGGPADGAAAVEFVRRIQNETKCKTILIPHHDVKPPRDGKDIRSRSDRASGGVLYSAAECPVNFERVDDRTCFAVPANYKIGSDPKPFRVRFESATGAGEPFRHFLRPVAETVSEQQDKEQRRNAGLRRGWCLRCSESLRPVKRPYPVRRSTRSGAVASRTLWKR